MFCSMIGLVTALVVLIEIRKGPRFISYAIGKIIIACVAVLIDDTGRILDWWKTDWSHPIGIFFYCLQEFMDIIIYFNFAQRYWETSFHISSYLKRHAAESDSEY